MTGITRYLVRQIAVALILVAVALTATIWLSQSLRFLRPVYPGDTVTARLEVTSVDPEKRFVTCSTECANQDGQTVVTGEATVLLDAKT